MKQLFRSICTVIATLLCLSIFTACEQKASNLPAIPVPSVKPSERADTSTQDGGKLVRTDAEGIVSVAVENGEASIHFDRERWNEARGLSYGEDVFFIPDTMPDAFYPIRVESGGVVDACIAQLPALEPDLPADDFVLPVVVLLMNDGSIEWFYANPNGVFVPDGEMETNYIVTTYGKLPYKDDFKSLSYEAIGEGHGESTIYITNAFGIRYDFLYLYLEEQLQYGIWVCEFLDGSASGYLTIGDNGDVLFRVGKGDSTGIFLEETFEIWEGTASFIKSPGQYLPLGMLDFDMKLTVSNYDDGRKLPTEMHGSYRAEITLTQDGKLKLYHNDGDELYPSNGKNTVLVFDLLSDEFSFEDGTESPARDYYAYIQFDQIGSYGWPQFLIDFVEWVDDDEANDYRIENETVEWVPFDTTGDTECTIWSYDTMEPIDLNVFDFATKLKNGELYEIGDGLVLVIVTVADDTIESISQVYTP